jgi:transcriptional regulator with XRE-family HTH domain
MNKLLRSTREKRGWTTSHVVRKLNIEAAKYIKWERDWSEPSAGEIQKLCTIFETGPEALGYLPWSQLRVP